MATSTFDRKIEISDPESVKKLLAVMADDSPARPISTTPYTDAERKRSEGLLKRCLSRSKH